MSSEQPTAPVPKADTAPKCALPHTHLLCMQASAAQAFTTAIQRHDLSTKIPHTIHESSLSQLSPTLTFDLVVSPANSYGILDGGFDDAISRAWSPANDYLALTSHVQAQLYDKYRGFLPAGGCEIVRMPEAFKGQLQYNDKQGWGCKYIAIVPTMRHPRPSNWDKELVFECVWSLLCAIDRHNRSVDANGEGVESRINSILMTPLGTATGRLSDRKWAEQLALGYKFFTEALENPERWRSIDWHYEHRMSREIDSTHNM